MSDPKVTVTLQGSRAEFKSHGPESDGFADYLSKMFEQVNNPGPAKAALLAKAQLGGTVLDLRKAQAEKVELLEKQAAVWEERGRDWSLNKDIRDLYADRARAAREESRKIAQELGE